MEASPNDGTAEELINETVSGADSAYAVLGALKQRRMELEASEAATVQQYIDGIRPEIEGALVHTMDAGIGGYYDGGSSVHIATSTLVIDSSVEETIARVEEVRAHENYHAEHDHLAPMILGASADGDTVVTIGGYGFTNTELIEGMTVAMTGHDFVSDQYRQYEADVRSAVAAAGINLGDVEQAIAQKDLTAVDDTSRERLFALAA